jgi:hypothetical protein
MTHGEFSMDHMAISWRLGLILAIHATLISTIELIFQSIKELELLICPTMLKSDYLPPCIAYN